MIFYIYGTDDYQCQQKLLEVKNSFIQKRDKAGLNINWFDGEQLELDHFRQEVLMTPFLGEKKMIIIKNIYQNKNKKEFAKFLQKYNQKIDNIICFIDIINPKKIWGSAKKVELSGPLFKMLTTQPYKWEYNLLSGVGLNNWIKKYLAEKKFEFNSTVIQELSLRVGNNLHQMALEINKLSAFSSSGKITSDDVKKIVSTKDDENIFGLIDAIMGKNKKTALILIKKQLDFGTHPLMIVLMIIRQFKIIIRIKNGANSAHDLGIHPYVFSKASAQSRKFDNNKLTKIYRQLLLIESDLKFGAKNPELLFDLFVIKN